MASRNKRSQRQQGRNDLARRTQQSQPQARANDAVSIVEQQVLAHRWQGPIPPPDDLKRYQEIDAALPGRILAMAEKTLALTEKQTDHRIDMERHSILGLNWRANAGLWLGFALALAVLGAATFLIYSGHDAAGATMVGIDLVGLAAVFVYGRHDQRRQEERRTES